MMISNKTTTKKKGNPLLHNCVWFKQRNHIFPPKKCKEIGNKKLNETIYIKNPFLFKSIFFISLTDFFIKKYKKLIN